MAHLEEPQRQFAVGPTTRAEDEVVHRAVHGLEVVLLAGPGDVALLVTLLVDEHRREHGVGVVGQVTRGVEQPTLGDLRGMHEGESRLHVARDDVFLDEVTQHRTPGMEDHQARTDLLGEGEQIELGSQLAMVPTLGLLDPLPVGNEILTAGPRGAVDALQLVVGLVTLPVGSRELRQSEGIGQILG